MLFILCSYVLIFILLKPQNLPNFPIGVDECSEVDADWRAVSFTNSNKEIRCSLYDHPSTYGSEKYSNFKEQSASLQSTG